MVGNVMQQDVKMEVIIADDDTAATSNIQRNQDPGLKKYSYKNYIKKNISESRHCLSIHLQIVVWMVSTKNRSNKGVQFLAKPLTSTELQEDIAQIFDRLKKHSDKLFQLGRTPSNESFNKTVASKAPKTHLYSRSIGYRADANVAQKNIGQGYLMQVI